MRVSRLFPLFVAALALGGCFQRGPQYVQYQYVPAPQAATAPMASAQMPAYQDPPVYQAQPVAPAPKARGIMGSNVSFARTSKYRAPSVCGPQGCGAASGAAAYASYPQATFDSPYLLDAGDRLRITVFGQEGLTNSYAVDAAGNVTLPLVGTIPARGMTTEQLSSSLAERLKQGYVREPKIAIEVEAYRPFFIHGEVTTPGQYAYVANMTVENAIAIAGGFGPRADRGKVTVSRSLNGQTSRAAVNLSYLLRPGDTLRIGERWF